MHHENKLMRKSLWLMSGFILLLVVGCIWLVGCMSSADESY